MANSKVKRLKNQLNDSKTVMCKATGILKNVNFSNLKYKARGSVALKKVRKFCKGEDISRTLPMKRYHPQANGQDERTNETMKKVLRKKYCIE